jgi:hypothetical protein
VNAWSYALRKGLRSFLGLEFAFLVTCVVVSLIFNGLATPSPNLWAELIKLQAVLVLIGFPAMVLFERYELRRMNRKKVS